MYFVCKGVRTEHVRSLSQFAEGKVKSEIGKNVTSVIGRSDVMFEHLRLKDHVHNPAHVCLYKSGSKQLLITENNLITQAHYDNS